MAINKPLLLTSILCLSLLLLFFGRCSLFANGISAVGSRTLSNRKLLATEFDFTQFRSSADGNVQGPEPSDNEIDPRYGVEKRLVPTGPNPLHH